MPRTGRPKKEDASLDFPITVRVTAEQLASIDHMIEESPTPMKRPDILRRCLDFVRVQKGLLDPADHREDLFTQDDLTQAMVTQKQSIAHLDALLEQDRDHKS